MTRTPLIAAAPIALAALAFGACGSSNSNASNGSSAATAQAVTATRTATKYVASPPRPTKAEYIQRADAACKRTPAAFKKINRRFEAALERAAGDTTPSGWRRWARLNIKRTNAIIGLQQSVTAQITKIPLPQSGREAFARAAAARKTRNNLTLRFVTLYRRIVKKPSIGDAAIATLNTRYERATKRYSRLAKAAGFHVCGIK